MHVKCFMYCLFSLFKLIPRRKIRVKDGGPEYQFKSPCSYYWPSQGGTFVAVSFVLCSTLLIFLNLLNVYSLLYAYLFSSAKIPGTDKNEVRKLPQNNGAFNGETDVQTYKQTNARLKAIFKEPFGRVAEQISIHTIPGRSDASDIYFVF